MGQSYLNMLSGGLVLERGTKTGADCNIHPSQPKSEKPAFSAFMVFHFSSMRIL